MQLKFTTISLFLLLLITACTKEETPPVVEPDPLPPAPSGKVIKVLHDEYESTPLVLVGSEEWNFILSFKRELDGEERTFTAIDDRLPIVMEDDQGTEWDWFGRGVNGPGVGQQLELTTSMMGYWFAFGALYPGASIHEGPSRFVELPLPGDPSWLIPTKRLVRATGLDAIQAIEVPQFVRYNSDEHTEGSFYVDNTDLVVGFEQGSQRRAYPHAILDWHEIVNDELGSENIAVVYCPLTGTATLWDRNLESGLTTFGVSGLLYNSNIIPYDRQTESFWTQLDGRCVNGALRGKRTRKYPYVETSWETWKTAFPETEIMSDDQNDVDRDYTIYPYDDYITNNDYIAFPLEINDDRLPAKERVHGVIINSRVKVYRFDAFR